MALQDEAHAATPTPLLPFAVQAGSRLSYRPELLTLSNAVVTSGNTNVTGQRHFRLARRHLADRQHRTAGGPAGAAAGAGAARREHLVFEGPARVTAVASGTFDRPILKGSLEIDGARLGDGIRPPFESVWVRVGLDGEQIRLDLVEARWQGAHLALSGMVPTWFVRLPGSSRTSAQATISGHIDEVTLKVLEPFVAARRPEGDDVRLEAHVPAHGGRARAGVGHRRCRDDKALLRSRDLGIAQRRPARLHLERGVVTLAPWTLGAPWSTRTLFTLGGSVTLPDADNAATWTSASTARSTCAALACSLADIGPPGRRRSTPASPVRRRRHRWMAWCASPTASC